MVRKHFYGCCPFFMSNFAWIRFSCVPHDLSTSRQNLKLNHFHYIQLINGSSVEILIQKRRSSTQLSLAYTCLSEMLQNHPEVS